MIRAGTIVVLLLGAGVARADDASVDDRIGRARELHEQGRHAEALEVLREAYAIDPRPDLLFAMAQMEFNLARYGAAIELYERFLETDPDPRKAALAQQAIGASRARLAEAAVVRVEPAPPPPAPPARDEPAFDGWSIGLVATGTALGAGAGVLYVRARDLAADTSGDYAAYERRQDDARDLRAAAVVGGAVAVVVVGVGLSRWAMRARDRRDLGATLRIDGDGVGVAIGGAW